MLYILVPRRREWGYTYASVDTADLTEVRGVVGPCLVGVCVLHSVDLAAMIVVHVRTMDVFAMDVRQSLYGTIYVDVGYSSWGHSSLGILTSRVPSTYGLGPVCVFSHD